MVSSRQDNAQRIAALDFNAEQARLRIGQGIAEARAMYPDLDIVEADEAADRRFLEALADWCDRYTPLVAINWPDGLYLDITGCAHLFDGEKSMMADICKRLGEQGLDIRAGLASTPGAAYALARFQSGTVIQKGGEAEALAPFPPSALRISRETQNGLESVGLRAIGTVASKPRAPLARRFGSQLLLRLDQAFGQVEEAITPRRPVPDLSVERRFFEPIGRLEDIEELVSTLAKSLQPALSERGQGATEFELALFRVDSTVFRLRVRAAQPLRDPRLIKLLFHEKLNAVSDRLDTGYGIDLLRLSVLSAQAFAETQASMMEINRNETQRLAILSDRVAARLGHPVILQPVLMPSHIPERAVSYVGGVGNSKPDTDSACLSGPARPLRLLKTPELVDVMAEVPDGPPAFFRWRRMQHRIIHSEGPERLTPEWWHDETGETRDYFRVEDGDGHRYWLFRQGLYEGEPRLGPLMKKALEEEAKQKGEFLQEEPAALLDCGLPPDPQLPRWYMHGIFA